MNHSAAHALFSCFRNSARKKGLVNSSTRFSESHCACAILFSNSARKKGLVNSSTRFSESNCACALLFSNSARNIVLVNFVLCIPRGEKIFKMGCGGNQVIIKYVLMCNKYLLMYLFNLLPIQSLCHLRIITLYHSFVLIIYLFNYLINI